MKKHIFTIHNIKHVNYHEFSPIYIYPLGQGKKFAEKPLVNVGQKIKAGDILSKQGEQDSICVHSAVGGNIDRMDTMRFHNSDNPKKNEEQCIGVLFGGKQKTYNDIYKVSMSKENLNTIINAIYDAGIRDNDIQGISNISSLLHSKISVGIEQIIINAVELESYSVIEEKILALHGKEIAKIVALLTDMSMLNGTETKNIICNSRYFSNRYGMAKLFKEQYHNASSIPKYKSSYFYPHKNVQIQNANSYVTFLEAFQVTFNAKPTSSIDKVLMIKPSVLLRLYEALFKHKPFIEKYIQITTAYDTSYFLRVYLGTPIFDIFLRLGVVSPEARYFFCDGLHDNNVLHHFSSPITKTTKHFFVLDQKQYKKFQRTMKLEVPFV